MTDLAPHVVRGPADLLALVPTRLGFHPRDSLVLLTVGPAGRSFHARVDLPRGTDEREAVARHLAGVATRCEVSAVAVVVYGDDARECDLAGATLADLLLGLGVDVLCALRADGERWWLVHEDGAGEPYDVDTHPFALEAVVEGRVVLPSRAALAAGLEGDDLPERDRLTELALRWSAGPSATGAPGGDVAWCRDRVRRFLGDGVRLDTDDLARLLAGAGDPRVRQALTEDGDPAQPAAQPAARHVDLWRDATRRAPVALRGWPAALLAHAAYLAGDGALAWCAVERSQDAQPDNGLAAVLTQALVAGVPPSVWRRIGRHRMLPD